MASLPSRFTEQVPAAAWAAPAAPAAPRARVDARISLRNIVKLLSAGEGPPQRADGRPCCRRRNGMTSDAMSQGKHAPAAACSVFTEAGKPGRHRLDAVFVQAPADPGHDEIAGGVVQVAGAVFAQLGLQVGGLLAAQYRERRVRRVPAAVGDIGA